MPPRKMPPRKMRETGNKTIFSWYSIIQQFFQTYCETSNPEPLKAAPIIGPKIQIFLIRKLDNKCHMSLYVTFCNIPKFYWSWQRNLCQLVDLKIRIGACFRIISILQMCGIIFILEWSQSCTKIYVRVLQSFLHFLYISIDELSDNICSSTTKNYHIDN